MDDQTLNDLRKQRDKADKIIKAAIERHPSRVYPDSNKQNDHHGLQVARALRIYTRNNFILLNAEFNGKKE